MAKSAIRLLSGKRQRENERRALARSRLHPDVALMGAHDASGNRQAKTGAEGRMLRIPRQARLLDPIELVKDRASLIDGDANAVINDTNLKAARIIERARLDLDRRLFGRVFERILD